jgi:hypothetical protein
LQTLYDRVKARAGMIEEAAKIKAEYIKVVNDLHQAKVDAAQAVLEAKDKARADIEALRAAAEAAKKEAEAAKKEAEVAKEALKRSKAEAKSLAEKAKKAEEGEYYAVRKAAYEHGARRDLKISLAHAMESLVDPGAIVAEKQRRVDALTEHAEYLLDTFVPQENPEAAEDVLTRLEAAPDRIATLMQDTSRIAAAVALASVKHHAPEFDLQKVAEEADLEELVEAPDVKAAAEEVLKKLDL